jgi:tRNA(Arg) A34 adenosine deaminase TadA
MAQRAVGTFSLSLPGMPVHELFTSCEPCAMCLGATLWSGVRRVVYGAAREDAARLEFDEGPVFPESYAYLEDRGIEIVRELLRDEARAVLELYRARKGTIYNG